MLSAAGGYEPSTTTHVKTAWKKFKELLQVLCSRHLSFKTHGHMYSSCCRAQCSMAVRLGHWQNQTSNVCSEMTGQWSDRSAMSSRKTLSTLDPMSYLCSLALRLWTSFWRRWYGHVERSIGAVKIACDIQVNGKRGPGRSKMTWMQLTVRNGREWKLSAINPHDRHTRRSGVRSAVRAVSQLLGRGLNDVGGAPVPTH